MPLRFGATSESAGGMPALRTASWLSLAVTMLICWFPRTELADINLTSATLQTFAFGSSAFLFALSDSQRIYRADMIEPLRFYAVRLRDYIFRVALLLILFAAVLEIGKFFAPARHARLERFVEDAGSILAVSTITYILVCQAFNIARTKHVARTFFHQAALSFRAEHVYARDLRAVIQSAQAICLRSDLSPELRLEEVRKALSGGLSTDLPVHSELLLDDAFGSSDRRSPSELAATEPAVSGSVPGERHHRSA